ncbi:amino acid starvation-responsive transcription factor GCN4 NDAI_0A08680 [Naumovozyma dairenensis CBS 421]|uniref:BZIP domain-containing protein n=1 Tax=Naumovozyma dairenensis (strain ATCC 10597 / BCRC 20456 / CBS 421 / NBRC 0211 / NRRL Y-12639) TaxID=1071378 RepID=G0W5D3_NAUDC|nr:hypothetical protein NDAI_0A08680 [Naumovozyma dairenensis CBS 421]CCD23021.1 hypothetical protein NDAI_0A08680 [Naumovozyma dairenensis CBS 421]
MLLLFQKQLQLTKKNNSSVSSSSSLNHPLIGEMVFDKFIKKEEEEEEQQESIPMNEFLSLNDSDFNNNELDSAVVDAFFSSTSDSTPMFEFESLDGTNNDNDPKQWTSLFDNDIPIITEEDVVLTDKAVELTHDQVSSSLLNTENFTIQKHEQQPMPEKAINTMSFLPTPMIEEAKLSQTNNNNNMKKQGKVSKKNNNSSSPGVKVDHLGVVAYNRKNRSVPLTPVVTESDDPVVLKRARNTEAARRSRARKLQRMNQLEEKVEELLSRNSDLENEVQRLRNLLDAQSK